MAQLKQSPRWHLNIRDGKSLLKGLLITVGGAVLVWLLKVIPDIDFGAYTPFIVPLAALIINSILKMLTDEKGKVV